MRRIIEGDKVNFSNCYFREADDGITALKMVQKEAAEGNHFDYILIDYIMVYSHLIDYL